MSDAWWLLAPIGFVFLVVLWAVIVDVHKMREASLDAKALRRASFLEEDTEWGGEE